MGADWPRSACNPAPEPVDRKALQKLLEEKYPNGIMCYPDPPAKVVKMTTVLRFELGHGATVLAATFGGPAKKVDKKLSEPYQPPKRSEQLIRRWERVHP